MTHVKISVLPTAAITSCLDTFLQRSGHVFVGKTYTLHPPPPSAKIVTLRPCFSQVLNIFYITTLNRQNESSLVIYPTFNLSLLAYFLPLHFHFWPTFCIASIAKTTVIRRQNHNNEIMSLKFLYNDHVNSQPACRKQEQIPMLVIIITS